MLQLYADGELIYTPNLEGYELLGLTATVSVERAGTAEITMPAGHPAYNSFVNLRTVVDIHRGGRHIFRGRALYPSSNLYGDRVIVCEGERGFLRDAVMQPYLYQADPAVIFADVISRYNSQVDDFKRFTVGAITATDPNGYVRLESEQAELVSDVVDKLVERVGGYITFSDGENGRIINWLGTLDRVSGQAIRLGENLLNYASTGSNENFATVLYPYGAKDETTGKRVTITSVNGGRLYVKDDAAVARHGWVAAPLFLDDVTLASNLLTKAKKELAVRRLVVTSLELTALDLSAHGVDIDPLEAGDNVPVESDPHGLNELFLLSTRDYDFFKPGQDSIMLGKTTATLTSADAASQRSARAQLQRTEQSIKTDYEIRISDAINTIRR